MILLKSLFENALSIDGQHKLREWIKLNKTPLKQKNPKLYHNALTTEILKSRFNDAHGQPRIKQSQKYTNIK